MSDLFQDAAADWEQRPVPAQIARGVLAALLDRVALTEDLIVMDFGAGTGMIAGGLAPRVRELHAVDVSPAMLAQLAAKEGLRDKVTVHCHDLTESPLGIQVDLVVSAMALHHVRDTGGLASALLAHLRPGGRIALADLDTEDGSFHPPGVEGVFHHGFDRAALRATLESAGFSEVELVTATVVYREGRAYPIFLATARKP